jgi:DASS family divalent anion:Na+ symporter
MSAPATFGRSAAGPARGSTEIERATLLSQVELFADVERVALAKLAAHLRPVALAAGEVLFREGDPGDAFHLVAKGSIGVYRGNPDGGDDSRVALLGPGDPLGEMALLTNNPRAATIRAETDAETLSLDRAVFLRLVRETPSVALAIAATLSRRLGTTPSGEPAVGVAPAAAASRAAGPAAKPAPWRAGKDRLAIALAVLALAAGWIVPPPAGLGIAGWHAIAILVAMVPMLALGSLPDGILALGMTAAWVVGGVAPARIALAGFASASWVLVVGVLTIGAAIAATGVLYRIALWTVMHGGAGFARQVLSLSVAGVLLGPAVPNATSRVALVAPVVSELVEALGYAPTSRRGIGLAMAALVGFGQMGAVFLTSSTTAVLVYALLPKTGVEVNWLSWAWYAAPTSVILFVGLIGAVAFLYRERAGGAPRDGRRADALALQRAILGPPSRNEIVAFAIGAAVLLGFVTQPLHGIDPAWVSVAALLALAATGLLDLDTLRTVNWNFALLFGAIAGIAAVFHSTGADRWLSQTVAGAIGGLAGAPVLFVAALTLLCFALSLLLRWQAAAPLVMIAIGPVAVDAGIDALVVALVAVIACAGFFLPYQSTTYLAMYHGTGGRLFSHAQARPIAVAYGVVTLTALCGSVPVWHAMGLL